MNYRLYIFDMGGVLARNFNVRPEIIRYLNIADREFTHYAGEELRLYSNGKISSDQFWEAFSRRSGLKIDEDLFARFFCPEIDERVRGIIRDLKGESRVVCGTNTIEPHYNSHLTRGDYDIFDLVYASHQLGLSKPDPRFYRYILNAERTAASETVFIDDTLENVEAALRVGIRAVLFRDPASLLEFLKSL